MPAPDWSALAAPLADDAPAGQDLAHDAQFLRMEQAAAGEPEVEVGFPGDKNYVKKEAKGPNWREVRACALALAERTRDLRIAVWLLRSTARTEGLAALAPAFELLATLVRDQWDAVHPRLDPGQPDVLQLRVNTLASLAHPAGGLADLRVAAIQGPRGALTLRQMELALGGARPLPGEAVPTADGVRKGVADAAASQPELTAQLRAATTAAHSLADALAQRLPVPQRPDLAPLLTLVQWAAQAAGAEPAGDAAAATAAAPAAGGEIATREDAIRGLQRICDWIEAHEPASPAPIFIRRSQQLLTKSFLEIIRDLLPDQVKHIEHYAGKPPSP